ncbi:double-strand break repair protein AddB [Thioclava sp. BHET1]|nr:double-strand break repair protein AddB [Thioclava sp. BHET1]
MFEPSASPRVFAQAPGADFPRALVAGLKARMVGQPPEAMARIELFVNTRRMQRRVRALFAETGALLLPRIRLVTDLAQDTGLADLPPAVPPLRRRLELTQLVARLLDQEPDLAPRAAIYDLADSLAAVMDEMRGEGVHPDALSRLDLADHSRHWERSLKFLTIVNSFFGEDTPPDVEARQRLVVTRILNRWRDRPPDHPIIVAGSTGSRGTTALFMHGVAALPQGALVLPGFDFDQPPEVWHSLDSGLKTVAAEDHPQYRYRKLLTDLGVGADAVTLWHREDPPSAARNRLVSLSLRPAPVTDQWMREGRHLDGIAEASRDMVLIEAPSPRAEALAIALCLRRAAEEGKTAALITPDRMLGRQVTAALDRWGILPDDSAGRPLTLSAPGRFLRHVAALFGQKLTADALLTLLKHPITHTGGPGRGQHLLWTRALEMKLRAKGPPFPSGADLLALADAKGDTPLIAWAKWLGDLIDGPEAVGIRSLADHVSAHITLAEALARGPEGSDPGELWLKEAGQSARAATDELMREAEHGGPLSPGDYADLFTAILDRREVREVFEPHPAIMIWGTLEARVQGADLVILGGLNDGIWPKLPAPDPWLSRQMRRDAGLLLPERQIGLSAHDYQQAVAAPEVVLSRAQRDGEAETVPSRWLNRLLNLMGGLPDQGGTRALEEMRARGRHWLSLATALDAPSEPVPPVRRPAPRPPVQMRPKELAVTGIRTLIRDPYAIYARYILRLRPLDPLHAQPDARLRGSVLHRIIEVFVEKAPITPETHAEARARLLSVADQIMAEEIPWPTAQRLWRARLERAANWFLAREAERDGEPVVLEEKGSVTLENTAFTLTAKPDRIDVMGDGQLHILDYKTGTPPTQKMQEQFDKQLLLEAAMAERGAFRKLGPQAVARITYIGLGSSPKEIATEITPEITEKVWSDLGKLIASYSQRDQGYTAQRAMFSERFGGDYDHLARFGEWDLTDMPEPEDVG